MKQKVTEFYLDENGVYQKREYEQDFEFPENIEDTIKTLKAELAKCKEDVEQVELFDMEREDYEQKKARCAEIIIELRKLESEVRDVSL